MIDEKKLIDTLRPYYDKVLHQNISDDEKLAKHDMLSDVMVEIKGQPKIGGWIPCSERLPEEGIKVLVWFEYFRYGEYNRLFQTIGISYTYNGKWSGFVNDSSGWEQLNILAWQPLPEAYHG